MTAIVGVAAAIAAVVAWPNVKRYAYPLIALVFLAIVANNLIGA